MKKYRKTGTCAGCAREGVKQYAFGLCNRCYAKRLDVLHPERRQERLSYMRGYRRENPENDELPSPLERVRLFCRIFSCSADHLEQYIMWLRSKNKRDGETPGGHARCTIKAKHRRAKRCLAS